MCWIIGIALLFCPLTHKLHNSKNIVHSLLVIIQLNEILRRVTGQHSPRQRRIYNWTLVVNKCWIDQNMYFSTKTSSFPGLWVRLTAQFGHVKHLRNGHFTKTYHHLPDLFHFRRLYTHYLCDINHWRPFKLKIISCHGTYELLSHFFHWPTCV